MSSGNLDALSAIATVLNPNISDEFPDNNVVDETLMAPPTDPQMMEEPFPLSQDTVKDTGQAVDDDAEAETFCDLDESTKEAGQQLQPRLIQEDLKNDWQNELNASGFVSCSVPGCQMRYSAIFSFERHYKWCTGEKGEGLETCEYCTCQFLATLQGIEDHVRKEHPSEINDYRAKRVARKIIKESREKEKKAREEKEARALELKREKQSLRATYQKRQTCYSKRQPVVKSDSENSRDDGSDKKVRFKAVVSVIHPDKLEDDESNVDDPVAQSLKEKVLDKPKRQPPKTKETAEVLQPARNWGVQRKTYSRSGGSTSDTSAKDVSQSDSETFLESNIAETSDAEVLAPENTILHEEFISVSHEKGISVEPVESNSILPEKVETVSQDAVPLPQESETSEEIVQSSEVPMDVSEEVVTFFNSGTEENVLIPIETEGCVTIGNEVQEPEEENYQLVIVTGESGESQYIVLDESLSQAFAEGVAANENELPESENSSFNVVSIPDEELAIAPANNLNETTNEIEVSSVEVNDSTNNKVLDNVQFQEVEEAGEITVEANSLPIAQSDENVIIECVSTMDSNTVIIEGESSEPSVVEVTQKDPIGVKIIPAARGVETASKGKINEPKKVIIKKRKPKISQSYKFASDSDDPKDPTIDRFQLPVPSNLSSINIGEDFLPPNLEKLLEFGGGKSDKHLKKGDMIADENSSSFPEPWTESVKISENKTNSPTITMSNTSGIFTKVINRNNDVFPSKPTMSEKLLNNVEKNQRDISAVDTIKRSSKTSANDYSKEDHSDNKSASLSDSCHSQSNDGASSSAAQISTSIQSLAGISGNPQIKIYMPKSDGTLAPLEDFSILSSNPQIRIMTPERDGTLKPMVVGDKKLILKSVQKMIATGSSSGTLKAHDNKISLLPEQTDKHTGKPQEIDIETTSTNTMTSLFDENVLQISNDNSHTIEIPNTSNNGFEDNLEQVNEFVSSTPNSCNDTVENKEVQVQVEKQSVKISQNDSSVSISEVESTTPSDVPIKRKRGRPPRNDPRFQGLSSGFRKAPLICNSDDDGPPPVKAMRQNSSLVQRKFVNTKIIARNNDINLELQSTMEESLSNDFGSLKKKMSLSSPLDSVSDSDSNIATPIRRGPTMRGGRYSRRRRGGRRGGWGRGRQIEETSMNNSLSLINDVDLDDNENDETTSFQCSACKLIFDNKTNAKNHIFSKHHGLAKINDETPLTDSEINVVLRNVLKVKRSLGCLNDDCGRFFRSTPGYLNHMKMCGVEVKIITCNICSENVMEPKYESHYKKHVRDEKKQEIRNSLILNDSEDQDEDSQTDEPAIKKRTTRRAALMANSRLEEFVKAERTDEDGKEIYAASDEEIEEEKPVLESDVKEAKDKDYTADEESEKSDEFSDGSVDDTPEIMSTYNQEWFRNKLEKDFADNYKKPIKQIVDPAQKTLLRKELQELKYISCKNDGCSKRLLSTAAAIKHRQLCGDESFYVCLICTGSRPFRNQSIKKFYVHMVKHKKGQAQGDAESSKLNGYKQYLSINLPNRKKLFNLHKLQVNPKLTKSTFTYYESHHSAESFSGFRPLKSDWMVLNNPGDYLPEHGDSLNFKIKHLNGDSSTSWSKLKLFEVLDSKSDPADHVTFNVGGAVWACDWCPIPLTEAASKDIAQYVALSISLNREKEHKMTDVTKCKGLIQIWNFGNLNRTIMKSKPQLSLAIGHNYGEIRDMKWCPSGCWDQPDESFNSPDILPRLGLLALACGDGCVRVLSIPHPEVLHKLSPNNNDNIKVYSTHPVFFMNSPESGLVSNSQKTCCTSISFEKTDGHGKIAAGYGNGLVSLWDLRSNSPLIVACRRRPSSKGCSALPQTLRPFHIFLAHSASVTSVTFSTVPNGRFIATCGLDRFSRIWDLDDTSIPVDNFKKAVGHSLSWSSHWCGYFMAVDDGFNVNNSNSFFKECGYYDFTNLTVSNHNSCIWKTTISDWLNCEASCDVAGVVNMTVLPSLDENISNLKSLKNNRWPIYSTQICSLAGDDSKNLNKGKQSQSSKKAPSEICIKNNPSLYLCNTYDKLTENYGLVYIDAPLSSFNQLSSPEARSLTLPLNMPQLYPGQYQIASVNNVSWNPNLGSHRWLISAGQAGLVRLSCVSAIKVPTVNRLLAKLTKDTERT